MRSSAIFGRKDSSTAAATLPGSDVLHGIVKENVETLVLAFESAGFTSDGWNRKGTIDWHVKCIGVLGGDWMKFYKYKIAAFFAAALDVEVPPSPLERTECREDDPRVVLGGKAALWAKGLRKRDWERNELLAVCVLYSKKGMVRPSKEQVQEAVQKAYHKLTDPVLRPKTRAWADIEDDDGDEPAVQDFLAKAQLRRTTRELLQGKPFLPELSQAMAMPSTSAVYTKTVAQGGMIGEMLGDPEIRALLKEIPEALVVVTMTDDHKYGVDSTELRLAYGKLLSLCWQKASEEDGDAAFVGLPEALKVRVITKGPPYRNFVLKTLQRHLWRAVRASPVGRLVGEYVTEEFLCRQVGRLREGEEYVSVDYSDATNEIHSWVSQVIMEEAADCIGLTAVQKRIAIENLVGHRLRNPANRKESKEQTRGQLMGSILSFPVLCIANIAICRSAQELDRGRPLALLAGSQGPAFCVNGDDAVMRGVSSYHHWVEICHVYGLSPSPGKVYRSRRFCNMNSTHFTVVPDYESQERQPTVTTATVVAPDGDVSVQISVQPGKDQEILWLKRKLYVNLGLLKGYKRSEVKASVADVGLPDSIGAIARWLVASSPPEMREWVLKKYLNTHWAELSGTKAKPMRLPWFLPEHLGGLGIPRPSGSLGQKNIANDMRLAAALYKHPLPRRPHSKEWLMMDKACSLMKKQDVRPHIVLGGDVEAAYGLRSLFVYSALLKAESLGALYKKADEEGDEQRNQYNGWLRKVEKHVNKAQARMGKVQPFAPDALPSQPLYEEVFITADAVVQGALTEREHARTTAVAQWGDHPVPEPGEFDLEW